MGFVAVEQEQKLGEQLFENQKRQLKPLEGAPLDMVLNAYDKSIIEVEEPHPRSPDFMLEPRFSELRNECYALLRDEIRQAMASQRDPQGEAR